ncbi:MAG: cytochrome-c peroxidase [Spirochaetia bacterium]|nr:cytochrome-c peroxidase [Spirochaetia bacterium]
MINQKAVFLILAAPPVLLSVFFNDCRLPESFSAEKCEAYSFSIPETLPPPVIPDDNCINEAKVSLGRMLFYEKKLSRNENGSCSTCHIQRFAFSDNRSRAKGTTGMIHPRNTPGLANAGHLKALTWSAPLLGRLQNQAINPLFSADGSESIVELGIGRMEDIVIRRLREDQKYNPLFKKAFGDPEITFPRIAKALEAFQLTFISFQSDYDTGNMSPSALRGQKVFQNSGCTNCHSGILFNEPASMKNTYDLFKNIGLYNIGGKGDYPDYRLHGRAALKMTQGLYSQSGNPADRGRFRIPSLRNLAYTAPYMHDGSIPTLNGVVEHFNAGGRNIKTGPFKGDGRENPLKDPAISPLNLSRTEKEDLLSFLLALSDFCFTVNPEFSDPNLPPPAKPDFCR